jgi:drug/metabolite transporter (DMT)-like permease
VTAVLLVTLSAALHAWWNYLVKRTGTGDVAVVWLYSVLQGPVAIGVVAYCAATGELGDAWWAALVSMVLHTAYAVILQQAYGHSDLSVVYPVSRGAAPLLVLVLSVPVVGRPSAAELLGIGLVVAGLVVMSGLHRGGRGQARAVGAGLAVAACIASYTLWDAYAVNTLEVSIVGYLAIANLAQSVVLSGLVRRRRDLPDVARRFWRSALLIAVLVPLSYALVLVALAFAPVAVVAATRSLNVVFATLLGMVLLREPRTASTLVGTAGILAGVLTIAAG